MKKKNLIIIALSLVGVLLVGVITAATLAKLGIKPNVVSRQSTNQAQSNKDRFSQEAHKKYDMGSKALASGDTTTAKASFTQAKELYLQAGNNQAAENTDAQLSLVAHQATTPPTQQQQTQTITVRPR